MGKQGPEPKDITGQKFGRLTAVKLTDKRYGASCVWLCKCDCGNEKEVPLMSLTSGNTRSCGCLYKEKVGWRNEIIKRHLTRAWKLIREEIEIETKRRAV